MIYDDINRFNEPGVKFRWPNLQDFEDWLLPPFHHDTSWEQNGSLQWTLHEPLAEGEMQGSTMYLGTDGTPAGQGSFLLIIGHVHAGFTNNNAIVIWWNEKNHVAMPQSGFRDQLILQGWREVVPYSGDHEVKRIFGDPADDAAMTSGRRRRAARRDFRRTTVMSLLRRTLLRAHGSCAGSLWRARGRAKTLKVGITLHPYYSFVANIVGDRAEIVPLIDADANPHGYAPQPADMMRITSMDVLVVNGIGHDTWAFEILDAAGMRDKLTLIYANDGVSLIPVAGDPSGAKVVNPHTFISTTAAIQQVYTIARRLGELDPANADVLSRQRAPLRARDPQAARGVRRADRRRGSGEVPLRHHAQRLRLHPAGARACRSPP